MSATTSTFSNRREDHLFISRQHAGHLFQAIESLGFQIWFPEPKQGAMQFAPLRAQHPPPSGWQAETAAGYYRLQRKQNQRWFDVNLGPQALKPLLFPARQLLWRSHSDDSGLHFSIDTPSPRPLAVIGVRACDIAALAILDKHFLHGEYVDSYYQQQRQQLFLVAVNCAHSDSHCCCTSTATGPTTTSGADLVFDELDEGFVISVHSEPGKTSLSQCSASPVTATQWQQVLVQRAEAELQQVHLPDKQRLRCLAEQQNHPRWQQIAHRCLACGNCTSVCPTCFCHKQLTLPHPDGSSAQWRLWDSCFSASHSYTTGKTYRTEISHYYRQWLTHKMSYWQQQYGTPGCVGCGRCSVWCPAAIDMPAEVNHLLKDERDG